MEDKRERKIEVGREPHLGSMLKKAGYTTSIFGKTQPLKVNIVNDDQEAGDRRHKKILEWRKTWANSDQYKASDDEKRLFFELGNYTQNISENNHYYDYSFSSASPCCEVNGFFENGQQTELKFRNWIWLAKNHFNYLISA